MQKLAAALLLMMLGCASALAGQAPADEYVACVIGHAAVNLHNGMAPETAESTAGDSCVPLLGKVDDEEAEGMSDFIHSLIGDIAASSVIAAN